jgi:glucose-6-phosphate isomerase
MDLSPFLADAHVAWQKLSLDTPTNYGLRLGAALALGAPERNKLLIAPLADLPGFGDWVEQLVGESTGKDGQGLLPVVGSTLHTAHDCLSVGGVENGTGIEISGSLGAQMLLWEVATACAAAHLGVNPFDQPNVESAKIAARELLSHDTALSAEGDSEPDLSVSASYSSHEGLHELISELLSRVGNQTYVALCVFGNSLDQAPWRVVAAALEQSTSRPVTLGFGPRFLHSTGQFHKGGPRQGAFIQVVEVPSTPLSIPGRDFSSTDLLVAQARGDARVIADTGQPILSITVRTAAARAHVMETLSQVV